MTTLTTHNVKISGDSSIAQYFSAEPEKQRIELSFLERFVNAKAVESAKELRFVAKMTPETRFAQSHAQMQNPVFRLLSSLLEQSVPEEKGFGKFRGRD